jgi:hypothetical protein
LIGLLRPVVEAVRTGRARERALAERILTERLTL